jgi:hypothetical protein
MRFTIVIPTKDRAKYLPFALRAALAQRDADFEVLVSDNASVDATPSIIDSFSSDTRLKRVRPDKPLSMVDHWNFALSNALALTRGDFFVVACDDDALTSDAMAILARYAARFPDTGLFQYSLETYYYDDNTNADEHRNSLKFRTPRPRGGHRVDGRRYLGHVFATLTSNMPRLLNTAVRRGVLEQITTRWGRIVHPWAPDFSAGVLLMHVAGHFVDIREPLMIWGKGSASYGAGSQANLDHLMEFMRQFPEFKGRLELVGYPELITVGNIIADTLLLTRRLIGPEADWMSINPWAHARMIEKDILKYQSCGVHRYDNLLPRVREDKRRAAVRARLALQLAKMPRRIDRLLRLFSPRHVRDLLHGVRAKTVRVDGASAGFSDIAAAAEYYTRTVRP